MKIGMISLYPPRKSKHVKLGGVASYTKNLVDAISETGEKITVFANKINENEKYYENSVKVIRCWDKGLFYPFQIFWNVKNEKVDILHIQHEYFLYGNTISAIVFPFMLLLLKLLRKPIIVTIHGVIPLSKFDKNFMKENNMKGNVLILKSGLYIITNLISWLTNKIVVHEDYFKDVLAEEYDINKEKIIVIPHGIEERKDVIQKNKAKKILKVSGKRVLLFFGYITGYKGIELLIDAFKYLKNKNYILFIAGGEHPRLKDNQEYQKYIKNLKEKARKVSKNIIFTGFVPEDKIPLYFSAADLIIFPYRVAMSSSGPMSFAISYEKPFLVSNSFKEIFPKEFIFTKANLADKIEAFFKVKAKKSKILKYIKWLKTNRLWNRIANNTVQLYENVIE